jgi:Tfp pilus assembly protein PilP
MKTKFLKIILFTAFLISSTGISSAVENAFGSLPLVDINTAQSASDFGAEVVDKTLHPLIQNSIKSNTVIGIMISPSVKIAYLETVNGEDYFVRVGDKLGNANGSITNISSEGIEVTEDNEVIILPVRNRSVSNEIL